MAHHLRVEYPGALDHFIARGNDRRLFMMRPTDRTDFLTGLGQEVLQQRWRSAKSSNDLTRVTCNG
jgi:hypothetical protein